MTEKESAHPSVNQLCELTAAATVNGVNSNSSSLLQQSSVQALTHNSSEDHVRKGDGEELPRSKSMVSMVMLHFACVCARQVGHVSRF